MRLNKLNVVIALSVISLLFLWRVKENWWHKLTTKNGEKLAEFYCGSCHLYTPPSLLPKSVWKEVLPEMGNRLGVISEENNPYKGRSMQEQLLLKSAQIFPQQPILSDKDWKKLSTYFLENAPDSLSLNEVTKKKENTLFQVATKKIIVSDLPAITMIDIDETAEQFYLADKNGYFSIIGKDFKVRESTYFRSPIIQVKKRSNTQELLLANIGIMNPNDLRTSGILLSSETNLQKNQVLVKEIPRLVSFQEVDIDGDELKDLVTCGFGYHIGSFSWYKNMGNGYEERMIKNIPGALKIYPIDADQDGDLDLMTLFAQGDEGLSVFLNENGNFTEKKLLRFHSVYGSSDVAFIDFDQDGDLDVVYTNGDNGDYSYALKPYHGVRIFINQGDFELEERYFFPMYGASKVKVSDYDQDGDLDIITISFYPDFEHLEESIVYLENQGSWQFEAQSFPMATKGRWLVMDSGDLDGDGDEDVMIGSFALPEKFISKQLMKGWQDAETQLLFLENKLK